MIKGVNKQIVEINCTRDEYIERAILFVNPQKAKLPRELLEKKAGDYLNTLLPGAAFEHRDIKLPSLVGGKEKKRRKPSLERVLILTLIICFLVAAIMLAAPFLTAA